MDPKESILKRVYILFWSLGLTVKVFYTSKNTLPIVSAISEMASNVGSTLLELRLIDWH